MRTVRYLPLALLASVLSACAVTQPHGSVPETVSKFVVGKTTYEEASAAMNREVMLAKQRDAGNALGSALSGGPRTHAEGVTVATMPGINGGKTVMYKFDEAENGIFMNTNGSTIDVLTVTLDFDRAGLLTNVSSSTVSRY